MRRITFTVASLVAGAFVALGGVALATPTENENPPTVNCNANSKNVVGHAFKVRVAAKNVDPSQARYATCAYAKQVAGGLTALRIEEPKVIKGFRCTPRVTSTSPDVVKYSCLFRGADTATEIRLTFRVKYDLD